MTTALADSPHHRETSDAGHKLRLAELTALTEAGQAIVRSQLDVDALCELVYEHTSRIVEARSFHLGLFEGDRFLLKVWIKDGKRQPPAAFAGAQDSGIIGWLRTTQQPLLVRDFAVEMDRLPARPSYLAHRPPRSAIFVPLLAGDTVVGTLSAQSAEPDAYSEDDVQLLSIMANQAASAIVNARLFAAMQHRAEQLMAVAEVARAITAVLDLDELLTKVVELIRQRFGYYHVQVYLVEDETHRAIFRASSGHHINKLWKEQRRSLRFDEGMIGWVAGSGQPLMANDVSAEPRYIADDPRLLPDTRSELAVPLIVEGEVLGVLDVQSRELDAFDEEDLFLISTLANQVAVAVDAAHSYRAQQEEAWITTVLLQVAEAASRGDTMNDVLTTVTRLVPMLTGVLSCGIWLWDEELGVFEPAAAHGLTMAWEEVTLSLRLRPSVSGTPALALMQQDPEPLDLEQGDGLIPPLLWQVMPGDRLILLPLLVQNKLMGCLIVSLDDGEMPVRTRSKRFTMLGGIANQAAAVIENVRLATANQEEAWISWALLEVSRSIGSAHSVDEMLDQVTRLTPLLAGIDRCAALLLDPASGAFNVVKEYLGHDAHASSFAGQNLQPGDLPLLDLALSTRRLQRVADVSQSDLVPPHWAEIVGSKTLVALPLVAQEEVLGVLLVDDVQVSHMVSPRREDILNGIAQQVALALENFRLQAQEQERVRLAQELQVARRIQASFLPSAIPQTPGYQLAHAWQSAREVGGDFYDFIALPNDRLGLLMADVADKGVPAALFAANTLTLLRAAAHSHDAPRRVLDEANRLIADHNDTDMFVTAWYGVLEPDSHILIYANAGHSLALRVRASDGDIQRLRGRGLPLGVMDHAGLEEGTCLLEPGDLIVLYTDGVIDILDEAGQEFGQDRLESVLYAIRHRPAGEIVDAVIQAVRSHAANAPIFDDITLSVTKRVG